jgi:hypothetical protein
VAGRTEMNPWKLLCVVGTRGVMKRASWMRLEQAGRASWKGAGIMTNPG